MSPPHNSAALQVLRIAPTRGWRGLNLRELWEYRELLYFLAWRDVKVRYKQTVLGGAWAILQPLAYVAVLTVLASATGIAHDGVPRPLFILAALIPWQFFSNSFSQSAQSLVGNANLIKKVYFPRLAVPIAPMLAGLVDLCLSFLILGAMMAWFGVLPGVRVFWLPAWLALTACAALGIGFWLSALNVEFRDIRHTVPFLAQLLFFATPLFYPSSLIGAEPWRTLYGLNPMVGAVEGFRWSLLGTETIHWPAVAVSAAMAVLLLVTGAFWFRRMERKFADVV